MAGFLDNLPEIDIGGVNRRESVKKPPDLLPAVIWRPVKCPRCRSKRCPVTSSRSPIRHHKCLDCELNFKSVEEKER